MRGLGNIVSRLTAARRQMQAANVNDDGVLDVGRHADRDHVLGDELAVMNGRVEAGGDRIDPAVVRRDLEDNVRIVANELSEFRGEHRLRGQPRAQQPHTTNGRRLQTRERRQRATDIRERRAELQ